VNFDRFTAKLLLLKKAIMPESSTFQRYRLLGGGHTS